MFALRFLRIKGVDPGGGEGEGAGQGAATPMNLWGGKQIDPANSFCEYESGINADVHMRYGVLEASSGAINLIIWEEENYTNPFSRMRRDEEN